MDRRRDRQAGRQTDTPTYTGIILCVILRWRVRVQSQERQTCSEFSHQRVCGAKTVRVFFFPSAIKCDQQRRPRGSCHLFGNLLMYVRRVSLCVCTPVSLRDRWADRTREQHRLGFCARACVRALVSKPNCSSVTVSCWAVAG